MITGVISNIQRFSTKDGPGLRTTVFFKGCPLRCPWCHNMETWELTPSLLFYAKDCAHCGACTVVCPAKGHAVTAESHLLDRTHCVKCGACADECPTGALEMRGETVTAQEILDRVLRDKSFYDQSQGGVTFSGGEVLMQFDFVRECAQLAKENGLHVCIDTSGWGGRAHELVDLADLYLWDVKHTDAQAHKALTGVALAPILDSLRKVDDLGGKTRLRCPIIPSLNDTPAHMQAIGALSSSLKNIQGIDLIPYHALGTAKSAALGLPATEYDKLTAEQKEQLLETLRCHTDVSAAWM